MRADVSLRRLKQINHLILRQPDRLVLQADFQPGLSVSGLVVDKPGFGGGPKIESHGFFAIACARLLNLAVQTGLQPLAKHVPSNSCPFLAARGPRVRNRHRYPDSQARSGRLPRCEAA